MSSKKIWNVLLATFRRDGITSANAQYFIKRFIVHPLLFILIIENQEFINRVPKSNIFTGPELLLMFLYRIKSNCSFTVLTDVFGGSESTSSDLFNKMISFMADFLRGTIPPFENIDLLKEVELLANSGASNPKACFVADCQVNIKLGSNISIKPLFRIFLLQSKTLSTPLTNQM